MSKIYSFFGLFTYREMDHDLCDYIYFGNVILERSIGGLPKGWKCDDVYLDVNSNIIELVKSWKPLFAENPDYLTPDEVYVFQMSDLVSLNQQNQQKATT